MTIDDVASFRETVKSMQDDPISNEPLFQEAYARCNQDLLIVPPSYGNDAFVPVYVSTPKKQHKGKRAAMVYTHGGGTIGGLA